MNRNVGLEAQFFLKHAFVLAIAIVLSGCAQDVLPITCQVPDFSCFMDQAAKGIGIVRANITYWANLNLIVQASVAICGIVATIMIALQGDKNKGWTRPIGLVATALVTGLSSALVSFHIPDNVDKLIEVLDRMTVTTNDFGAKTDELVVGRSKPQIEEAYRNDEKFRDASNKLTVKFVNDFNRIKIDMLKLSGTAGKLHSITQRPNSKED